MAKFYGTLQNDKGKQSTRCGYTGIKATAQSWEGSVSVRIFESDGKHEVQIYVDEGSTAHPQKCAYIGNLADLVKHPMVANGG